MAETKAQKEVLLVLAKANDPRLRWLENLPDTVQAIIPTKLEEAVTVAPQAKYVLVCDHTYAFEKVWPSLTQCVWVHSRSAGVNHITCCKDFNASPTPLSNSKGLFSRSLGEYVITACSYFTKEMPTMIRAQAEGKWTPVVVKELYGQTIGIVGYGSIGAAIARIAKYGFGMRVIATRRCPENGDWVGGVTAWDSKCAGENPGDGRCTLVDAMYGPDGLHKLMSESDFVAVSAALTPSTRGLVDAAAIARMKPSGVLLNVGRGPIIVEEDLLAALQAGSIKGAALDVFDEEPLPEGHPYYSTPNLLLSAHTADNTRHFLDDAMQFFLRNLALVQTGEQPINVVDKSCGY